MELDLVAIPKPAAVRLSVWDRSFEWKMLRVIERVPRRMNDERLAQKFRELVQPETLATLLVLIGLFSLLSGGTALVLGLIAFGMDVMMSLAAALQITYWAANPSELDDAADNLVDIIFAVGVAVFLAGVLRIASRIRIRSANKSRGTSPTEPSPPQAKVSKSPQSGTSSWSRPIGPPPFNMILESLRRLSRGDLLTEIRRVTRGKIQLREGQEIVLWEQIPYGEIYTPVRAGRQVATELGVRPGEVIGYIAESKPTGASSVMGMDNVVMQNVAPYLDPFLGL
jgi:hypothetical protein